MSEFLTRPDSDDVERGIEFFTDTGEICVSGQGTIWDLSPEELHKYLHELRPFGSLSKDAGIIQWVLLNDCGRFDGRSITTGGARSEFERAPNNPFLSAEVRSQAGLLLNLLKASENRRIEKEARKGKGGAARHWGIKKQVVSRDQGRCRYCGIEVGHKFHLDHVIPRAYGGLTTLDNLVVACVGCNLKKGGRTPAEAGMALIDIESLFPVAV